MDVYIYAADIYCEDCGRAIRERLDSEGKAPADPDDGASYDSGDYPKGPFSDEESDTPEHCACGDKCLNPHVFPSGYKAGAFIGNPLTLAGERYVREMHRDDPSEVTEMWMRFYELEPLPDPNTPVRTVERGDGQPSWELVANLGDADPITYGGYFVYRDRTGQSPPEADVLESVDESIDVRDPKARWIIHTVVLDTLDDPDAEWFGDDLDNLANQFDPPMDIRGDLKSDDPVRLAWAYREIGSFHGFDNLDHEPARLTLAEVKARYPEFARP